jgi:hypothetical protein
MMKRRALIGVVVLLLAFFGNRYMQAERYDEEIYDGEAKVGFKAVNNDIQRLITRSFEPLFTGPGESDDLRYQVEAVIYTVDLIIKDLGKRSVPKEYKKANQDLLAAYKSFRPSLTEYLALVEEAAEQNAVDSPSAQKLSDAYQQISLAAEQWYTNYKKENNRNDDEETAEGSLQNQLVYEEFVKRTVSSDLQSIEGNILPNVEKKDYVVFYRMLDNYRNSLPVMATYLKRTKVTEPYAKAHQNLLNAYTNLYAFIVNTEFKDVSDEAFEQFTTHYEELKKAMDDWNVVLEQQTTGYTSAYMSKLPEEEVAKHQYARTNYDIQQLILRSYQRPILGPKGQDNLKIVVDIAMLRLNEVVKEMEDRKVPEQFEQAHQDLLAAYQNFLPVLTDYGKKAQWAVEQEDDESPSNQQLNDAYLEISGAADQWYKLYEKVNNGYGLINQRSALGSIQEQLVYEEYVQRIAGQQLTEIELSILPYVKQKNIDGALRMQTNQKYNLSSMIAYMKQTKVPEAYEESHQNMLSVYTDYYNLITNVQNVNDDYLEKIQSQYKEMKNTVEEWKKAYLAELGNYKVE